LFIAVVAVFGVGLGLAVRRWWFIGIACMPSLLWLVLCLQDWGDPTSDTNGADYFFFGFWYAGLPLIVAVAIGVGLGRWLIGPPGAKPSGTTEAPR
jgi:hypothetical protein